MITRHDIFFANVFFKPYLSDLNYFTALPRKCLFEHLRNVEDCVIEDVKSLLEMENKKWQYGAINVCRYVSVMLLLYSFEVVVKDLACHKFISIM